MDFLRLIFLNIRRHKLRSLITASGIGFGAASMLCIVSIVLGAVGMFQNILSTESQFILFERNVSDLFFSSVRASQLEEIRKLGLVKRVDPLLVGIVSSPNHPIITCFGVDADNPRLRHARWLGGSLSRFGQDRGAVCLGERAASFLKKAMGEEIQIGSRRFLVGGILRTANGFEDGGVFFPLPLAQEFFHKESQASLATVELRPGASFDAFRKLIDERFPDLIALEDKEFNRSYSQFRILNVTSWAIGICSFLLGGMGVANTMLMSVFARVREIAVLRVCGFSRRQVASLILGEAVVLSGLGSLGGCVAGLAALAAMNAAPQLQGYVRASLRADLLAGVALVTLVTAIAGAFYPAYFASRIAPAEALRYE
ncbi:ABC transporter permease [Methylacidimicrobium sp. B4]|uniref:ABC transporter permease n=1 Tax=Methylacidimicrobium sp. B4 TaxID=2796139 RepID=UPI001A8C15AB|nr:ABC transporter permease [Methylacidimicrobium sp. B4]QSR85584.1 ABC transporter permease [Methylacidimicrobium sp. B4]